MVRGDDDIVPAMQAAGLALSTAGTTCWELCCVRVPAALLVVAENQRPIAQALADHGVALDLGWVQETDSHRVAEAILWLAGAVDRRQTMAAAGRRLVDGLGAARVVEELLGRL